MTKNVTDKNECCICANQIQYTYIFKKMHTVSICHIVNVYVTDADFSSKVYSPCCIVFAIIRYCTLTFSSTISVHTIHCILTTKVSFYVWPWILLPRWLMQCQIFYIFKIRSTQKTYLLLDIQIRIKHFYKTIIIPDLMIKLWR